MKMGHNGRPMKKMKKSLKTWIRLNLYRNCKLDLTNIEVVPVSLIPAMNSQ